MLSLKQVKLWQDIVAENKPEIYVLGSTQSGKTHVIARALLDYMKHLHLYDPDKLYYGAIVGWTIETLKGNIVEVLEQQLKNDGNTDEYKLVWNNDDKSLTLWNVKMFFFGFNNV